MRDHGGCVVGSRKEVIRDQSQGPTRVRGQKQGAAVIRWADRGRRLDHWSALIEGQYRAHTGPIELRRRRANGVAVNWHRSAVRSAIRRVSRRVSPTSSRCHRTRGRRSVRWRRRSIYRSVGTGGRGRYVQHSRRGNGPALNAREVLDLVLDLRVNLTFIQPSVALEVFKLVGARGQALP